MAMALSSYAAGAAFTLGIVGAPALIAAAWMLGHSYSWLLVLVPAGGAALWCFSRCVWPKAWLPQEKLHSFRIRGIYVAILTTSVNATLYTFWFMHRGTPKPLLLRVLSCLQNLSIMCGLMSALHASAWLQPKAPRVWPLPLALMLLALPLLIADRVPFSFLGLWPLGFDNAFAVVSIGLAWATACMPPLHITVDHELRCKSTQRQGLSFYCERLQQLCAALSFLYLMVCFLWTKLGHLQVLDITYHLIWSLLRPAYVLLYFVYYLKRLPRLACLQSFVTGVGFFYFVLFSALTETKMTYHGQTRFLDEDEPAYTPLGQASHRIEALGFYVSMILFYVHGICSGSWAHASEKLPRRLALLGSLAFVIVFLAEYTHLDPLRWFDAIKDNNFFVGFVLLHYGLGYGSILIINMALFETQLADTVPRHRVSLKALPAEATQKCKHTLQDAPDQLLAGCQA